MRTQAGVGILIASLLAGVGCFRGADVSKIICNDTKYCPSGYVCVMHGSSAGRCERPQAGGSDGAKLDGAIVSDGPSSVPSSKGGAGGAAGNGGAGGGETGTEPAATGGSIGSGGSAGAVTGGAGAGGAGAGADGADAPMATGGTSTGGATGSDAAPNDFPPDVFTPDAPGTCSTDKDCPAQQPLCLGNRCAKCAGDSDCAGRSGPACATNGLCVGCTANSHCKGTAATCDSATNQCVGCTKRSDCSGACQTCTASVCVAVNNQDDPTVCTGTCDATGACKSKQGQTCKTSSDCVNSLPCADGVCCDGACSGQCQACAEPNKVGTCTTVMGSPRGSRPQCTASNDTCAGSCSGSPTQCGYPGASTVCSGAACSGDLSVKPASVCDGAGACTSPVVTSCAAGKYCTGGACVNQIATGGTCESGNQCSSGNCTSNLCCASGQTACSGACVSVSNNSANCGSCGRACATGSACSGGSCYLNDGQACTTGNQCRSGVCSTFYLDADGDGYGISTSIARCGNTPPSGYAVNSGDCCDSDGNAHPGQTSTFTVADGCGSYDYNCDGKETPLSHGPSDCGTITCFINPSGVCAYNSGCTCGGANPCLWHSTAACGQPYYVINSVCGDPTGNGSCVGTTHDGVVGNQECN